MGCSTDSTDNESIFPVPPIISENQKETTTPEIQIEVVNPLVPEPIVEPVVAAELMDNIAPQIINSSVRHGDIDVDPNIERFVFIFGEDIGATNFIKLIDNTTGLNMGWIPFIRDRQIELTRFPHNLGAGLQLIGGHVYTITIHVADRAHNWAKPLNVTFVTEFIDFAAEEQAIRDLYAVYATAHSDQDVDTLAKVWLSGESKDIFTAWTFWVGTFEKNEGAKAVSEAWAGIFRLRGGNMEVDITYIAIDSRGKEAVLRGSYNWGNQGGALISALKKDGNDWKIRAIDYTDGRFGTQIETLVAPAHIFEEIIRVSFKNDIQPILAERCAIPGCHAAPGAGGLNLSQYNTFKKGGNSGAAFSAGNGKGSLVVKRIDGGGMPPIPPSLNAEQIQLFINWIDEGSANN